MSCLVILVRDCSNLTAKVCLILAISTLSDLFSKCPIIFLVDFEQVFYKCFLV